MKVLRICIAIILFGFATLCQPLVAQADITIKVAKGGMAPYLYAYTGDGASATKYTGDWPGTQYTETDADGNWTMTITGINSVNVIFSDGGSNQTSSILNVRGVNGVALFEYNGKTAWFGAIPSLGSSDGYVYFNCPPDWGNSQSNLPYVYFLDNNNDQLGTNEWPGWPMEYAGVDGAGFEIYRYYTANWNGISKLIFNCGSNSHQTGNLNYTPNGYYNTNGSIALVHALTSGNGYTDANFRAGIAAQLGINDGNVFVPGSITYLNVSNLGISSLAGISHFTNLKTLIASNNSLSTADLGNNAELEVLDLSGNSSLRGFNSTYSANSNYINLATNNHTLRDLNLANCNIGYFRAINSHYGVNSLKRLNLAGNSSMGGWSDGIGAQTGLLYLNVSGNGYGSDALRLTNLTQLDTLIADNNPNLGNISTLGSAGQLRYVSLRNCGLTNSIGFGNNHALEYIDISDNSATAKNFTLSNNSALKVFKASNAAIKQNGLTWNSDCPALDTLIVAGNMAMQYLSTLNHVTGLKYLDMSGGDLYLHNMPTFVGSNFPELTYIDFSNDKITSAKVLDGFPALTTLKSGGNTSLPSVTLNNCPAIATIDLTGNTTQTTLALTNQGYGDASNLPTVISTGCSALTALDLSSNNYTAVPDVSAIGFTPTSLYLNSNDLTGISLPSGSPVQFLYAEDNGFSGNLELNAEDVQALKGLDLGNNGITSFKAEGTALSALMLGNNTSMTTLELHGNDNLTCTTAQTTMSEGSGLYLLGNTALNTIDLSNSSFNQIGANNALLGLTAVKTLNGSHNAFTSFTNSNYDIIDNNGNSRLASYVTGKSSLEDLTGLEKLDLSYNEIADSVHLWRNTALTWLDVSHNNKLGPLATTDAEKLAMRLRKADLMRKYHNKSTPIGISCPAATQATLTENETECKQLGRPFDYRDKDLRDTTGLYHLDLNFNVELKYLDISETNIHNTAAGWTYMCPGWEIGTGGWYSTTTTSTTPARSPANGSTRHHFVWLQTCGKLEEFHADNNSMQSLGVRTSPYLHTITAKGMHGDCYFMRDYKTIGNGNITISGNILVYDHTNFYYENGELKGTVIYRDADGVVGGTHYFPNPVKWYDVSNSDFYIVRPANGKDLEHLDVSGNHLSELKVSGNTKLQHVNTENNDLLTYVDANDLPDLDTLMVGSNPMLQKLYVNNDPSLPTITGLDECTALQQLHAYNDVLLGQNNFNVNNNTALTTLWVSNCSLPGELSVSHCAAMDTLRCDNNALTKLDVSSLQNIHWLDCYNNTGITTLVPGNSAAMTHLDLHNCSVLDLDVAPLADMRYFDCDNNHVRELTFADAANIETLHANSNNLFQINMGASHAALKDMQFAHNHINAIDLSGCNASVLTTFDDSDNGRTIRANCNVVNGKKMYFFQLQNLTDGSIFLDNSTCDEDAQDYGRDALGFITSGIMGKDLASDGFNQAKVTWSESPVTGLRASRAEDYDLDPERVLGTILVLENTSTDDSMGSGTETYQYNNGIGQSAFYLNWTADSNVITAVEDISAERLDISGGDGCITLTADSATTVVVYDMGGHVVVERSIEAGTTTIEGLQPGIYVVGGKKVVVK